MKNYFKKMKDKKIQQHQYKKVSVVITAYNEEKDIKKAIHSVREYVDEIIVVDDGSTDKTALLAKEEGVIVFQHQFNMGAGAALKSGYQIAFDNGAEAIAVYAGDCQGDPKDIKKQLDFMWTKKLGYVIGCRLNSDEGKKSMPKIRRFGNTILSFLTSIVASASNYDSQMGHNVITRAALAKIDNRFITNRWGVPNDVFFECVRADVPIGFLQAVIKYDTRESYIKLGDFFSRLVTILIKGTITTSVLKPGTRGGVKDFVGLIIWTLILSPFILFFLNLYYLYIFFAFDIFYLILAILGNYWQLKPKIRGFGKIL